MPSATALVPAISRASCSQQSKHVMQKKLVNQTKLSQKEKKWKCWKHLKTIANRTYILESKDLVITIVRDLFLFFIFVPDHIQKSEESKNYNHSEGRLQAKAELYSEWVAKRSPIVSMSLSTCRPLPLLSAYRTKIEFPLPLLSALGPELSAYIFFGILE